MKTQKHIMAKIKMKLSIRYITAKPYSSGHLRWISHKRHHTTTKHYCANIFITAKKSIFVFR